MKTKELIKILELGGKILSHYKDRDVAHALGDILDMCNEKKIRSSHSVNNNLNEVYLETIPSTSDNYQGDFFRDTEQMSLEEVHDYLNDKKMFPNIESLRKLAASLGLSSQSRVNRDNLIYSISKIIDRSRIDREISMRNNLE